MRNGEDSGLDAFNNNETQEQAQETAQEDANLQHQHVHSGSDTSSTAIDDAPSGYYHPFYEEFAPRPSFLGAIANGPDSDSQVVMSRGYIQFLEACQQRQAEYVNHMRTEYLNQMRTVYLNHVQAVTSHGHMPGMAPVTVSGLQGHPVALRVYWGDPTGETRPTEPQPVPVARSQNDMVNAPLAYAPSGGVHNSQMNRCHAQATSTVPPTTNQANSQTNNAPRSAADPTTGSHYTGRSQWQHRQAWRQRWHEIWRQARYERRLRNERARLGLNSNPVNSNGSPDSEQGINSVNGHHRREPSGDHTDTADGRDAPAVSSNPDRATGGRQAPTPNGDRGSAATEHQRPATNENRAPATDSRRKRRRKPNGNQGRQ